MWAPALRYAQHLPNVRLILEFYRQLMNHSSKEERYDFRHEAQPDLL